MPPSATAPPPRRRRRPASLRGGTGQCTSAKPVAVTTTPHTVDGMRFSVPGAGTQPNPIGAVTSMFGGPVASSMLPPLGGPALPALSQAGGARRKAAARRKPAAAASPRRQKKTKTKK